MSLPPDEKDWAMLSTSFPGQELDFTPDPNGNVTGTTSPQAGVGYGEAAAFSPVGLLGGFNLPAGDISVGYTPDRVPDGGESPWGALDFDAKGRLTSVGDTEYTLDEDGFVTHLHSLDGDISLENFGPAPTEIEWAGSVAGRILIERNQWFQPTSIQVEGMPAVGVSMDADGVVTQVGQVAMVRSVAGFLQGSTVDETDDIYARNSLGRPCATRREEERATSSSSRRSTSATTAAG